MRDFDWFLERLDVARWEDQSRGTRSAFFGCPVHGGSDSLHVTEKNERALVKCFACPASYSEIVEALEAGEKPVRVIRRRGRVEKSVAAVQDAEAETGGAAPPRLHQDPLDWTAERCGLTRAQLDALGLPIEAAKDAVAFTFAGSAAIKFRKIGEGKKKAISWISDGSRPDLWPVPSAPTPEVFITEGEFDAICMRHSGFEAYSITAGASTAVDQSTWEALRTRGVQSVVIVFDNDREGRKGRDQALEDARGAGLTARSMRPAGIDALSGEKDVRDAVLARGYPIALDEDATEDDAVSLRAVELAPEPTLLLGWLHPLEHTILFGDGGTGKGVLASQWATDLVRVGKRVLIVDYEQHARHEWRPRIQRFLCAHEEFHRDIDECDNADSLIDNVLYIQPVRPIWEIASWLQSQAARAKADYLIVDSVTYAVAGMEPEKSETAVKYSQAINIIGYPILSIAHVPKSNEDPRHPFGSVYWHNGARVTVSVTARDETPDADRIVKHRKTNQGQPEMTTAYDWTWLSVGLPPKLSVKPTWKSDQEAFDFLKATNGGIPTREQVEEALHKEITDASFRTLRRRSVVKGRKFRGRGTEEP